MLHARAKAGVTRNGATAMAKRVLMAACGARSMPNHDAALGSALRGESLRVPRTRGVQVGFHPNLDAACSLMDW